MMADIIISIITLIVVLGAIYVNGDKVDEWAEKIRRD